MKEVTFKILFKLLLKWSLGLRVGFRRGILQTTPLGSGIQKRYANL